jgi:hypothetical protein
MPRQILSKSSAAILGPAETTPKEATGAASQKTKTVELPAPSTECYAELDAPTIDRGVLKILFAKPGPGRPTAVCSITVEKQPLAILLAGLEAATRRLREARDELPGSRLPEEFKAVLEWSQDSLQICVKGRAGAKRQAMARVRKLVPSFSDGVGLIAEQGIKDYTWRSTIPFRLRVTDGV